MKIRNLIVCSLSVFLALGAASCGKKNLKKAAGTTPEMVTETAANPDLAVQESTENAEGNIRGGEFTSQATITPIYFGFDKYALSEENRAALQKNAAILRTHRDWAVLVEGYCDSRGTVEYNLALGQKRAKEVRDYYTRLGVPESSIGTISYGKEKPSCADETEECWSQNRRAETKVKAQ